MNRSMFIFLAFMGPLLIGFALAVVLCGVFIGFDEINYLFMFLAVAAGRTISWFAHGGVSRYESRD